MVSSGSDRPSLLVAVIVLPLAVVPLTVLWLLGGWASSSNVKARALPPPLDDVLLSDRRRVVEGCTASACGTGRPWSSESFRVMKGAGVKAMLL
jgi:hypothetical protein